MIRLYRSWKPWCRLRALLPAFFVCFHCGPTTLDFTSRNLQEIQNFEQELIVHYEAGQIRQARQGRQANLGVVLDILGGAREGRPGLPFFFVGADGKIQKGENLIYTLKDPLVAIFSKDCPLYAGAVSRQDNLVSDIFFSLNCLSLRHKNAAGNLTSESLFRFKISAKQGEDSLASIGAMIKAQEVGQRLFTGKLILTEVEVARSPFDTFRHGYRLRGPARGARLLPRSPSVPKSP